MSESHHSHWAELFGLPEPHRGDRLVRWAQRCMQVLLVGFLLAGAAGYFGGSGAQGTETLGAPGALQVTHSRWAHWQAPYELKLEIAPAVLTSDELVIWFEFGLLGELEIESIRPEPIAQEVGSGRVYYRFRVVERAEPVHLVFQAKTLRIGRGGGRLGVCGGPEIDLRHFVYP